MALNDDRKKRGTKGFSQNEGGSGTADRDLGHALRSVYSKTVGEDIPLELLDLLGKLK